MTVRATLMVREPGGMTPDFSLEFDLPEIPRPGDYISVSRPDTPPPWSEDLIVRRIWWRLRHPEIAAVARERKIGTAAEIVVECDPALGPTSSDAWRAALEAAKARGVAVQELEVERFSVRQAEIMTRN